MATRRALCCPITFRPPHSSLDTRKCKLHRRCAVIDEESRLWTLFCLLSNVWPSHWLPNSTLSTRGTDAIDSNCWVTCKYDPPWRVPWNHQTVSKSGPLQAWDYFMDMPSQLRFLHLFTSVNVGDFLDTHIDCASRCLLRIAQHARDYDEPVYFASAPRRLKNCGGRSTYLWR